ncbi:uncharacterized protein DFL_007639 [Arthrobotrys flagrans]|uniref:Uncharacterized protein n=1 Tax=Arthrobotrys flagrans TaxID=97331 RepID=A0A436ZW81_ARTFL|nr:hypothetical protein DFL_007639 [Arthrobotrys flagrans]
MEHHRYPKATPPVVIGPSSMQTPQIRKIFPISRNERGPMSPRQYLQSKGPSNKRRQTPPWKKTSSSQNSNREVHLRDDHPIYHDSFYISHIQMINSLKRRVSRLIIWTDQVQCARVQSKNLLETVHSDIMKVVQNPIPSNIENRVQEWEFQIQTVGSRYKDNQREGSTKCGEWRSIRAMMDGVKMAQKAMMEVVMKNMPKLFWRSSAPLKRMLELGKEISQLEPLLAQANASLTRITLTDGEISDLFTKCNEGLMGVVDVVLEKIEGRASHRVHESPQINGGNKIPGNLFMRKPLNTVTEKALNKAIKPLEFKV